MIKLYTFWRHFDFLLFGAVAVLTVFGITMIRSSIAGNIELAELNLVNRQVIFVIIGFAVVLLTTALDYHYWSALSQPLYWGTVITLSVLFIVGAAVFGSARWFDTGVILIQPSELAKIVIVLVLADFFARHKAQTKQLQWIGRSFLLTLGVVIWILLQPNLSTSMLILVIWLAMLWASGLPLKYMLLVAVFGIIIPIIGFPFLEDYQQQRVINFLFPDPTARHGEIYNIQQALITIGSGGWFGKGYNLGSQVQLRFLKVRHTDFIFSAMAEEFGFVGTVIIMLLFLFVILRCLRVAQLARDSYGALICYGVATLLAFQGTVNIGVNLNMLPATGLTLPFISYGGSSMLSSLLGVGLVESVILRHKTLEF